jgi:hypothetical protein
VLASVSAPAGVSFLCARPRCPPQSAANESVDVDASVNELFGLLKASFSASSDYQKMFSNGQSGSSGYVGTTAVCTAYKVLWDEFNFFPNLTTNFELAVGGLGGDVSYHQFVNAFGTCPVCFAFRQRRS